MEEFKRNPKHDAEAADAGLEIIGKGKNKDYRLYRFKECDHEQEIAVSDVRRNKFRCNTCQERKIKQEADDAGLEIIGVGKDCYCRKYRFSNCQHEQEIAVGDVRRNKFRCNTCQENKVNKEAAERGLEIIGIGCNSRCRLYRCLKCGHSRNIYVANVRRGKFMCSQCGTNESGYSTTKPGSLYLFHYRTEDGREFIKYGITNRNVDTRSKEHIRHTNTVRVDTLLVLPFENGNDAVEIENDIDALRKRVGVFEHQPNDLAQGSTETLSIVHVDAVMEVIRKHIPFI